MATNAVDHDVIKCPICFEHFTNPKYLPCLHTFCHSCLNAYILSQFGGEGQTSKSFPCPVCRQTIQVVANMSLEKIADQMPGNHLIKSLMEKSRELSRSRGETLCYPCSDGNQNIPATSWCTMCCEALCDACTSYHKRLKERKHNTVSITEAVDDKSAKLSEVDEPCMTHSGKILEVYCVDHKQMCCVICLATQHRRCENISTFEDMVNGNKDEESVEDFVKRLHIVEERTGIFRTKVEDNIKTLEKKHDEMSNEVSTVIEIARSKLTSLKDKFLLQLKQTHKQQNAELVDRKERIEAFENSVRRGSKLMMTVSERGSPKQIFITKEKLKMHLNNHMECLKKCLSDCKDVDYVLHVSDTVKSVSNSLDSVAQVDLKCSFNTLDHLKAVVSAVDESCIEEVNVANIEVYKIKSLAVLNFISGGTFLPDGKLVLCNYETAELKLYDRNMNHLLDYKLDDKPWDAVCVKDNEILVSFLSRNYLQRLHIEIGEIKPLCKIPCKQGPQGLAVINDNVAVAYTYTIDIVTRDGKHMKTIDRPQSPRHFVAGFKTGTLYYNEKDTIVCRSEDGSELFKYGNREIKYVAGIALDYQENVFLCGYKSGNVHVLSRDGKQHKLLLQNLNQPYAIGFDSSGKNFFLSLIGTSVDIYEVRKLNK